MNTAAIWITVIVIALIALVLFIVIKRKSRGAHAYSDADTESSCQLYVGNLSYSLRDYQLKEAFSAFGEITTARIINHPQSRRSKGFGFVTFESPKSAKKALKMHGKDLNGRSLVVRIANPRGS